MKESKKRLLSLLGTIGVCTIVLVGTAYAWYNTNKNTNVSNIKVNVVSAHNLEASFDNVNFARNLSADFDGKKFKQATGNGANFYTIKKSYLPEDPDTGVVEQYVSGYRLLSSTERDDYLYFKEVYFRVDKDIRLRIDSTSTITPATYSSRLTDDGYTKDYIAGAIRFAVATIDDATGNITSKFIWAPNSMFEFETTSSGTAVKANGNIETSYTYAVGTNLTNIVTVTPGSATSGSYQVPSGPLFVWGNLLTNHILADVQGGVNHFAFSVWVEGTDRECVEQLSGGQVSINIKFTSEEISSD